MLEGGCACGAIRYRAEGEPLHETVCHCGNCRRSSGAPVVAWFSVTASAFRFVKGEPRVFVSSAKARREFCPGCGTQLTFAHIDFPDEIDITTCSLDDPQRAPPRDETWMASTLGWFHATGLPRHARSR